MDLEDNTILSLGEAILESDRRRYEIRRGRNFLNKIGVGPIKRSLARPSEVRTTTDWAKVFVDKFLIDRDVSSHNLIYNIETEVKNGTGQYVVTFGEILNKKQLPIQRLCYSYEHFLEPANNVQRSFDKLPSKKKEEEIKFYYDHYLENNSQPDNNNSWISFLREWHSDTGRYLFRPTIIKECDFGIKPIYPFIDEIQKINDFSYDVDKYFIERLRHDSNCNGWFADIVKRAENIELRRYLEIPERE